MEATHTRVWTLWFCAPGGRKVKRGTPRSLAEAWKLWDWVCGKVDDGMYRGESEGELKLMSPEGECMATCDLATRERQIFPAPPQRFARA